MNGTEKEIREEDSERFVYAGDGHRADAVDEYDGEGTNYAVGERHGK